MTAQTLIDKIKKIIDSEFAILDKETKKNYLSVRKSVLAGLASMWDKAAIQPRKNVTTGQIEYVSRAEAFKYNRFKVFEDEVKGISKKGLLTDISNLEYQGMRIYQLQYNGYSWVYNQAYGLPLTGGVRVPLVASAIYSDTVGQTFIENLNKRWAAYADNIITMTIRDLNAGKSYYQAARDVQAVTDSSYSDALRIARTEAHRIQTQSYLDNLGLLDEIGVDYQKMWISTIDDRTRDAHQSLDGKMADKNGIFTSSAGGVGPAPGQMSTAADNINCRCEAVTIIDGEKPTERRIRGEGIVQFETYQERLDRGGDIPISQLRKYKK